VTTRQPIRRARADEATAVADLWLASRRAAAPAIPPPAHTDDEVRAWFRDVVLPNDEVWVIGPHQTPEAMMVLSGDWVEQPYVSPDHQRKGHGSRLISFAQAKRRELRLWAFEANTHARAFYEKLGFSPTGAPSSANEEGSPALCYRWNAS
jgi:GNAT superfamily N-acetyltransferase